MSARAFLLAALAAFACVVVTAQGQSMVETIRGNVPDGSANVELEVQASSLPNGVKSLYTAPVQNGAFSQDVRVFPGINRVTVRTDTGATEMLIPRSYHKPTLTVELWYPDDSGAYGDNYILYVNGFDVGYVSENVVGYGVFFNYNYYFENHQTLVFPEAEAGLYRVIVFHNFEGWPWPPARTTTINVRLDGNLVYAASNCGGELWSAGTFVVHSGDEAGGFCVDGAGRLDLPMQGANYGFGQPDYVRPLSSVSRLAGTNGTGAVCLRVGDVTSFTAEGSLYDPYANTVRAGRIIERFTSSDESVGTVDALGVLVAKTPGHTQVNCEQDYASENTCTPIDVYVVQTGITVDADLDGDVDDADAAKMTARASPYHWNMPVATNAFRPVRLDTGVAASGALGLTLAGDAAFRVWATDAPGPSDQPLIDLPGDSVGGETLGITLPYTGSTTLFVEAASNGTATLTYAFVGSGTVAGAVFSNAVQLTAWDIGIAMDGDRDGGISLDGTNDTSYVFWVNDDCDKFENGEEDDAETGPADCSDGAISCMRDLEDFARLHIRLGKEVAALSGLTYWLKFENVVDGSPAVNLYEAVSDSDEYLSSTNTAALQLQKTKFLSIYSDGHDVLLDASLIKSSGEVSPFLLEGAGEGSGDLTLVVKKDGAEICRNSVRLELHPITWFYDIWLAQVLSGERWETVVDPIPIHVQASSYVPKTGERILFVHGWNMAPWEKKRWTETMFKRLWWQGYRGSVALFDWPTLANYSGVMDAVTNMTHFDNSEYRAWQSADALATVITEMNGSGNLRVLAHSMGNVAVGEALQKYGGHPLLPPVHTYIACQAALSAHYYDNTVAANNPCKYREFDITFPGTPDIIGHAYTGDAGSRPYLVENSACVGNLQNWYNPDDWVLRMWEMNNITKPDNLDGYRFRYEGAKDSYYEGVDHFFGGPNTGATPLVVTDQTQRRMIFAYAMESRSKALGQTVNGAFNNWDLENGMGYNNEHYSHSREFRSDILAEHTFWARVFSTCGFQRAK